MHTVTPFGLSCALALPLQDSFQINLAHLVAHAHRCLASGCSSITIFGTTGEGASISRVEREQVLTALSEAGIPLGRQVLGGVAAASVGDAADQARSIIERSCRGLLVAPPFYYKDVTDEGLYAWFSRFFEKIAPRGCDVILYHIPAVTGIALSGQLISQLRRAFPEIVKGVKDSGTDWSYTERLLKMHDDLLVLIGNETHLSAGMRLGAHGAISGMANLCPEILASIIETGIEDTRIAALAREISRFPFTAAVKALLANRDKNPAWSAVRPPLTVLSQPDATTLSSAYDRIMR